MSSLIIGLFGADYFFDVAILTTNNLIIPQYSFILACGAAFVSGLGYFVNIPFRFTIIPSALSYFLLAASIAYLVVSTGTTTSPFIGLWMIVAVFAGIFSSIGVSIMFIAVTAYLVVLYLFGPEPTSSELLLYILAGELPVLISYFLWYDNNNHENDKDKAFSQLAAELSVVADKSQIVINAIADGVLAVDSKGIIQLINPAAQSILGWSQADALNLKYDSVLKLANTKGEPLEESANPIQQVLISNKPITNDNLTLATSSGKLLLISLLVSPAGTNGSGAIIVFRDVTQQRAEEREQAEFISTASHEMRTPVASIEGYLGLALNPQTATIDEKAREYLTKAHESARHLGHLFQDLLDVTKVDDGRISNNPAIVDVVGLAAEITSIFEAKAKEKGLMLYFKPGTPSSNGVDVSKKLNPVFYINADYDHLREVLTNLIENGIKYTPHGNVAVDVQGDSNNVTISIRDSGIGIPPEDVTHLFQKFYRVDNSSTREIGGTGLGLYLCRRLVEAMQGKIWVDSEYGKGSTFYVQFTRVSHEDAMAQLESVESQTTENAGQAITPPQMSTSEVKPTPEVTAVSQLSAPPLGTFPEQKPADQSSNQQIQS